VVVREGGLLVAGGERERALATGVGPDHRPAAGLWWQVGLVLAAWLFLCELHPGNDGLWYQGDAPRHAANGLFWKDFLQSGFTNPRDYTLRYYARYPAICPMVYPPAFYLLEAAVFGLAGPSPFAAKGLELAFALLAGLYTLAWLRRWVAPAAGAAAALLLLCPGLTTWSHAVMLNVPSAAVGLAALYHARRGLEAPGPNRSWHLVAAAGLAVLATLMYSTAGVVVFVGLAWVVGLGRWRLLTHSRVLLLALGCAALLAPWAYLAVNYAPRHVHWVVPTAERLTSAASWLYYPRRATELASPVLLAAAAFGTAVGLAAPGRRREALVLLAWVGVCYATFSNFGAKESRYLLIVCPALVGLTAVGLVTAAEWVSPRADRQRWAVLAALAVLLPAEGWLAWGRTIPSVTDFRAVAGYVSELAPTGPVLYCGYHDGVFVFHVLAGDPGYRRQVLLGRDLLGGRKREVSTAAAEEALLDCGCRWLVVEYGSLSAGRPSERALRRAVAGQAFERVRSFPLVCPGVERVDVYRVRAPRRLPAELALPIQLPGADRPVLADPIQR
jgi:hypothetical protein